MYWLARAWTDCLSDVRNVLIWTAQEVEAFAT